MENLSIKIFIYYSVDRYIFNLLSINWENLFISFSPLVSFIATTATPLSVVIWIFVVDVCTDFSVA